MPGRKRGTKIFYTPAQTRRYRSYALRKLRAERLPAPTRDGTAYIFKPRRRGVTPYRVTTTADQSDLRTKVTTATHAIAKVGNPTILWDFADLTFRWAVTFATGNQDNGGGGGSSGGGGGSGGGYFPGFPPFTPGPDPVWLRQIFFGYRVRRYYSFYPLTQTPRPSPEQLRDSYWTGFSDTLNEFASPVFLLPESVLGDLFGQPVGYLPTYQSLSLSQGERFYNWIEYDAGIQFGNEVFGRPTPYGFPAVPGWFTPGGSDGGGGGGGGGSGDGEPTAAAGIVWTSNTFPLTENLDILLSVAYSVRSGAAAGSGVEVFQNGVSYAALDLEDFRRGAQFQDRPLTLLGGFNYSFKITLAQESRIDAALIRLGGDSYVCTCPDWNRKSKGFPSRFPSELGDRDWSTSGAGARGDCKHIIRVRLMQGLPLLADRPDDLDEIRQWREDRQVKDKDYNRLLRQEATAARRQQREDARRQRAQQRQRVKQIREKYKERRAIAIKPRRARKYGDLSY